MAAETTPSSPEALRGGRFSSALIRKAYVWSVVFDPLLMFVLTDSAAVGVSLSVSRILQSVVLLGLALPLFARMMTGTISRQWRPGEARRLYSGFWVYFALVVIAGALGAATGAYSLFQAYDARATESGFSRLLNSPAVRPVFEYLITLYYFVYFMVLPVLLLKTRAHVGYMFQAFKTLFVISFAAGVIDYSVAAFYNIELIPRHLSDGRGVGTRFHGFAGEPRSAFVYMFLGLAMLHLRAHFSGRRLSRWWTVAVTIAALLGESTSGLIGLACFAGLYAFYSLTQLSVGRLVKMAGVLTLVTLTVYFAASNSRRIVVYAEAAGYAWAALETGRPLPSPLNLQRDNLYPLYDIVLKMRNLDFLPILIGSGLGSASAVNNRLLGGAENGLTNPNAQLVRSLYESGLVGTIFFVMLFVQPVRYATRHLGAKSRRGFVILTLLLVGCSFGVRSSAAFIYVGALIATFRVLQAGIAGVPASAPRPDARVA